MYIELKSRFKAQTEKLKARPLVAGHDRKCEEIAHSVKDFTNELFGQLNKLSLRLNYPIQDPQNRKKKKCKISWTTFWDE
jgi:hypothetical protein